MTAVRLGSWEINTTTDPIHDFTVTFPHQIHGPNIVNIKTKPTIPPLADGLATSSKQIVIAVKTADCLPLVLATSSEVVVLHLSRHNLSIGILDNISEHIDVGKIIGAYLGPHLCAQHAGYKTIGDSLARFIKKFSGAASAKNNLTHISLLTAVKTYLNQWEIPADKTIIDPHCTFEDNSLPSHRRQNKKNTTTLMSSLTTYARPIL